jgi:cytochrome c biogenesis protein CcmG, thiol:disulfide interchange protein DsbE
VKLKNGAIWLAIALAAGIYLFPIISDRIDSTSGNRSGSGIAPAFSLQGLNGESIRLSDFAGKVVLVNFWSSRCPPCRAEIPGFERVYTAYRDRGFAIIGITSDDLSESFIRQVGITYSLATAQEKVVSDYTVSRIPVSFLVGGDGRIVKKVLGVYSEGDLSKDVASLLKRS